MINVDRQYGFFMRRRGVVNGVLRTATKILANISQAEEGQVYKSTGINSSRSTGIGVRAAMSVSCWRDMSSPRHKVSSLCSKGNSVCPIAGSRVMTRTQGVSEADKDNYIGQPGYDQMPKSESRQRKDDEGALSH